MTGKSGKIYRIHNDPICGRQLVATRKILAGELIIDEPALVTGPGYSPGNLNVGAIQTNKRSTSDINNATSESNVKISSSSSRDVNEGNYVCLVCCKNLSEREGTFIITCPSCGLKLCSESCCSHRRHSENECLVFPKIRSRVWNDSHYDYSKKSFYNLILVIRALFYRVRDSRKWSQIRQLESKSEALEKVGAFSELESVFNCLSWDMFSSATLAPSEDPLPPEISLNKDDYSSSESIIEAAKHCLGVMRINAFSLFTETYSREGLFFLSSFMSHSCVVNTDRQIEASSLVCGGGVTTADGDLFGGSRMVVRASVDIEKDEPITTTYLSLLHSTDERHRIMITNWLFTCHCQRCQDPTEGTFSGGIRCRCHETEDNNSIGGSTDVQNKGLNFKPNCECFASKETVDAVRKILNSRPKHVNDIRELELWFDQNDSGTFLHPHNSVFSHLKLFLCQYYGRQAGGVNDLTLDQLKRKVLYCHQILSIYDKVMPGIQMCRGVLLFEMWCALERLLELKELPFETAYPSLTNDDLPAEVLYFDESSSNKAKTEALAILKYALPDSPEEEMTNILRDLCESRKRQKIQSKN